MTAVDGYCPMGCGRTLFLGEGGCITCSFVSCPDRLAVDTILGERESEHLVEFRADTFVIRHPLRERVDDQLMQCALHTHVEGLSGPPVALGTYRSRASGEGWAWERMETGRG